MTTLKKIIFNDVEQYSEDINSNFAIIQNSPLFKGIPGKTGADGKPGIPGIRGSKFIFVNFNKFNAVFVGELTTPSQVNKTFINSKLFSFQTKMKLFEAMVTDDLIHGDTIVLTNSMMLQYDIINNVVFDTGIAFNDEINLTANIEKTIENYVSTYVNSHPELQADTILSVFNTYAKNYADTNNSGVNGELTNTSIYAPFYPGLSNNSGYAISDHKYFSYTDAKVPENGRSTIVFGSMRNYIRQLFNTVSTGSTIGLLTSEYAPGENRTPALIVQQNDTNSGIMFGPKTATDLSRFAHIYKDSNGYLIIKTDGGRLVADFSKLSLHNTYGMLYDRPVRFRDNLTLSKSLILNGQISHPMISTGIYATNPDQIDNILQLGGKLDTFGNIGKILFKNADLYFDNHKGIVFETDGITGKITGYTRVVRAPIESSGFQQSDYHLPTTKHIAELYGKIVNNKWWIDTYGVEFGDIYTRTQLNDGLTDVLIRQKTGTAQIDHSACINYEGVIQHLPNDSTVVIGGSSKTQTFDIGVGAAMVRLLSADLLLNSIQTIYNDAYNVVGVFHKGLLKKNYIVEPEVVQSTANYGVPVSTLDRTINNLGSPLMHNTGINIGLRERLLTANNLFWLHQFVDNVKTRFVNTFNKQESLQYLMRQPESQNPPFFKDQEYYLNNKYSGVLGLCKYGRQITLSLEFKNLQAIISSSNVDEPINTLDGCSPFGILIKRTEAAWIYINGVKTYTKPYTTYYGPKIIPSGSLLRDSFVVYNRKKSQSMVVHFKLKTYSYGGDNGNTGSSFSFDVLQLSLITDDRTIAACTNNNEDIWYGSYSYIYDGAEDYQSSILPGYKNLD